MADPAGSTTFQVREHVGLDDVRALAANHRAEHAFALYDLDRFPEVTEVVGWSEGGSLSGYLLIWRGDPAIPIVHWIGSLPPAEFIAPLLPPRPFLAVVPPAAAGHVEAARGPVRTYAVEYLQRSRDLPISPPPGLRRLRGEDRPRLMEFARRHADVFLAASYARVDPAVARVMAAEDDQGNLVAVARTQVEVPGLWIVGGVFTAPEARRKGLASAITSDLVHQAAVNGADTGLYVRDDNLPALSAYRKLGFRVGFTRSWLDAGAGRSP